MKISKRIVLGGTVVAALGISALVWAEKDDDEKDEAPVAFAALPAPVQKAATAFFGSADKLEATKEDEDGASEFEVAGMKDGAKAELKLTASGDVLEVERASTFDALPAAARESLKKKYPKATFGEVEAMEVHVYEVKITNGKKTEEVIVIPSGKIGKDEE